MCDPYGLAKFIMIGSSNISIKMKEVTSIITPPMPKDLLDKLVSTVIQEQGDERSLEWLLNDDGTLDLFVEGHES